MDFYGNHKDLSLFYEILEVLEQVEKDIKYVLSDDFNKHCDVDKQTCANQFDLIGGHLAEIPEKLRGISNEWYANNKKDVVLLSKELNWVDASVDEIMNYLKIHSLKFKYEEPKELAKAVKNDIADMRLFLKGKLGEVSKDREQLEKLIANILMMNVEEIHAFSEDELNQLIEKINFWSGYAICMNDSQAPQNYFEKEHIIS